MRCLGWAISVAILALVFMLLWYISRAVYVSYSAEQDYFYTIFVLRLVDEYVSTHGEWPRSWEDLEHVKRSETSEWPKNFRTIQQRVLVDVNVTVNELAMN